MDIINQNLSVALNLTNCSAYHDIILQNVENESHVRDVSCFLGWKQYEHESWVNFALIMISTVIVVNGLEECFPAAPHTKHTSSEEVKESKESLSKPLNNEDEEKEENQINLAVKYEVLLSGKRNGLMKHECLFFYYGILFWILFLFTNHFIFILIGSCVYIRQFQEKHEIAHFPITMQNKSPLHWVRYFDVVISPLQISFRDICKVHLGHHKAHNPFLNEEERIEDPDDYLVQGPFYFALFHAFTEPEQALIRYVNSTHKGNETNFIQKLDEHQIKFILLNTLQIFLLVNFVRDGIFFLITSRVLNSLIWIIFHYGLHQEQFYKTGKPLNVPCSIRILWRTMFGADNLHAILYHAVHHQHPSLPANSLQMTANKLLSQNKYPIGI